MNFLGIIKADIASLGTKLFKCSKFFNLESSQNGAVNLRIKITFQYILEKNFFYKFESSLKRCRHQFNGSSQQKLNRMPSEVLARISSLPLTRVLGKAATRHVKPEADESNQDGPCDVTKGRLAFVRSQAHCCITAYLLITEFVMLCDHANMTVAV
jgi:hypothetical protein